MKLHKEADGKRLMIALEGRLDTASAPELEKELQESLPGTEELIFDLESLDYVSSAGLRVFLFAAKTMRKQGSMKLVNVSEVIYEILEVTGFSEILTIE